MTSLRNKVQLIGHLGEQPDLTTFESGSKKARFSLAVNNSYRDSKGEYVKRTMWITVFAWAGLAESMGKNLLKGDEVIVMGSLESHEYEGVDKSKRTVYEVKCDSFRRLTERKGVKADVEEGDLPF